jgi:hypothetical protein
MPKTNDRDLSATREPIGSDLQKPIRSSTLAPGVGADWGPVAMIGWLLGLSAIGFSFHA